jgi:hypothetical protein
MEPEVTLLLLLVPCLAYVAHRIYQSISTRRRAASTELTVGGVYTVRRDGKYRIAKVLVVDPDCVQA